MKPPTSTVDAGAALERRQHVVAQPVDEIRRRRRLRRRARVGLDHRDLARRARPAARSPRRRRASSRPPREVAASAAAVAGAGQLGDEQQRAVEARRRSPWRAGRRPGACSCSTGRCRRRSCRGAARTPAISSTTITTSEASASGHGRACTDHRSSRASASAARVGGLRRASPARPRRRAVATAAPAPHDAVAEARQHRRQQRQRRRQRQQHREHRGDREPVQEAHAGREHPEQRDHHRRAGEQDRAPGGVHRLDAPTRSTSPRARGSSRGSG